MNKFTSPYGDTPATDLAHPSIDISHSDHQLLRNVPHVRGGILITGQLLIHALCNELRKRSITDYTDADTYRYIVGELCDSHNDYLSSSIDRILSGRPASSGNGQSAVPTNSPPSHRNDNGAVERLGGEAPNPPHKPTNPPSGTVVGSGGRRVGKAKDKTSTKSGKGVKNA